MRHDNASWLNTSQVNRRDGVLAPHRAESFISHGVFGDPAQASLRAVRLLIDGERPS
jgi:hypothetical protein